jgi:hypothetical protein
MGLSIDTSKGLCGVSMARKNGKDYVSIVEIKPGEEANSLWDFWKTDEGKAGD